jgi:hypothetical protein
MPALGLVGPYRCDGPDCRRVCASHSGLRCGWLVFIDPRHPWPARSYGKQRRGRRWFCSWTCLSKYACAVAEHLQEVAS